MQVWLSVLNPIVDTVALIVDIMLKETGVGGNGRSGYFGAFEFTHKLPLGAAIEVTKSSKTRCWIKAHAFGPSIHVKSVVRYMLIIKAAIREPIQLVDTVTIFTFYLILIPQASPKFRLQRI